MEINDLYNLAKDGQSAREDELFHILTTRFSLFLRQRLQNQQDIEEIVQEAMLVICKEYKKIEIEVSFSAWAYKILKNRFLAHLGKLKRTAGRNEELPDNHPGEAGENISGMADLRKRLMFCLGQLSEVSIRYARIVNLHQLGFGTEDICGRLKLTSANFYSILSRARKMLESCLEKGELKR